MSKRSTSNLIPIAAIKLLTISTVVVNFEVSKVTSKPAKSMVVFHLAIMVLDRFTSSIFVRAKERARERGAKFAGISNNLSFRWFCRFCWLLSPFVAIGLC